MAEAGKKLRGRPSADYGALGAEPKSQLPILDLLVSLTDAPVSDTRKNDTAFSSTGTPLSSTDTPISNTPVSGTSPRVSATVTPIKTGGADEGWRSDDLEGSERGESPQLVTVVFRVNSRRSTAERKLSVQTLPQKVRSLPLPRA